MTLVNYFSSYAQQVDTVGNLDALVRMRFHRQTNVTLMDRPLTGDYDGLGRAVIAHFRMKDNRGVAMVFGRNKLSLFPAEERCAAAMEKLQGQLPPALADCLATIRRDAYALQDAWRRSGRPGHATVRLNVFDRHENHPFSAWNYHRRNGYWPDSAVMEHFHVNLGEETDREFGTLAICYNAPVIEIVPNSMLEPARSESEGTLIAGTFMEQNILKVRGDDIVPIRFSPGDIFRYSVWQYSFSDKKSLPVAAVTREPPSTHPKIVLKMLVKEEQNGIRPQSDFSMLVNGLQ